MVPHDIFPWENKHDSHRTSVPECPREKLMNWPLFWFAGATPKQLLPLHDGQGEKCSFEGCSRLGTPVTFKSRAFVAVVVSCGV